MATVSPTVPVPNVQLVESDGEPMDTPWHRDCMNLLIEQVRFHERDRRDYFVGGNMFIYFSLREARNRDFRGPDFFFVRGVRYDWERLYYVVWEEDGRYPDVIIELLSSSTEREDRTTKKEIYERTFRTPEYFLYDPETQTLDGFRHNGTTYTRIEPDARGWLWCEQLGLWLGTWHGPFHGVVSSTWLRFHNTEGQVVPLFAEAAQHQLGHAQHQLGEAQHKLGQAQHQLGEAQHQAEAERQRAEAERRRAEAAEAELAQLRAQQKKTP